MIAEGDRAQDFTLLDDSGSPVTLSELRGHPVVLYFYPKDDTPGCTTEACEFRDQIPRFEGMGAQVFGISPDDVASHGRFRDKFDLNFRLLSDPDHVVAHAYGVWREKSMYGRTFWGIERSTFLIDVDGVVRRAWRRVKPAGHAEAVADAVARLGEG